MRIIPNSKFKIYKNINVDDDVTIVFASAANREAYFAKHLVAELNTQNGVLFENNVEAIADEAKRAGYKTKIRVVDNLPWGL